MMDDDGCPINSFNIFVDIGWVVGFMIHESYKSVVVINYHSIIRLGSCRIDANIGIVSG
jgi:hypothetical protein